MATKTSRFSVQGSAIQAPGHCLICSGVKGPFIHVGLNLRMYGVVLLCFNCVKEMSTHLPETDRSVVKVEKVHDYGELGSIHSDLVRVIDDLCDELHRLDIPEVTEAEQGNDSGAVDSAGQDGKPLSEQDASGISSDSSDDGLEFNLPR